VGRRTLREDMVEFAAEAMGLAGDTVEFSEGAPEVDRDTMELVASPSEPM
jgi:hypothetical protein